MTNFRSILAGALALSSVAFGASAFANTDEDVKITELVAYGDACKNEADGKPQDYAFTISPDGKTFSVDYSNFILDEKKRSSECTVVLNVDFPEGKTAYVYSSQIRGEAVVKSGDTAVVSTNVRVGSGAWKKAVTKLDAGHDGDFETKATKDKDNKASPCGGKSTFIVVQLSAELTGSGDSFLEVTSTDGKMGNVMIKAGDCD